MKIYGYAMALTNISTARTNITEEENLICQIL